MSSSYEVPATLEKWAGAQYLNLTLVFTDIVESTAIGRRLGDRKWIEELFEHFSQARSIAASFDCFVVKVIGDSLMMAFRTSTDAVEFALEFAMDTAVEHIGIRVGINSGQVQIRENDIYGLNVNFTSRVQHALPKEGILVSHSVMKDYEKTFGTGSVLRFRPWDIELKSFGKERLFRAMTKDLFESISTTTKARDRLLGIEKPVRPL